MLTTLRKIAMAASLVTAGLAATPAMAADAPPVVDACSATWVVGGIACVGYYDKNQFQGGKGTAVDPNSALGQAIFNLLNGAPTNSTAAYSPNYNLTTSTVLAAIGGLPTTGNTITFSDILLNGLTVVGIHWGNTSDAGSLNNISALWLVNITSPTNTINLVNGQGKSNIQVFATQSAVPEPATWALMLAGFGAVGYGMRRRRRNNPALLQLA